MRGRAERSNVQRPTSNVELKSPQRRSMTAEGAQVSQADSAAPGAARLISLLCRAAQGRAGFDARARRRKDEVRESDRSCDDCGGEQMNAQRLGRASRKAGTGRSRVCRLG